MFHEKSVASGEVLSNILRLHCTTLLNQPRLLQLRVFKKLVILAGFLQGCLALVAQIVHATQQQQQLVKTATTTTTEREEE